MQIESPDGPVPLRGIYIDLAARSITFQGEHPLVTRLTLGPRGVLYELLAQADCQLSAPPAAPIAPAANAGPGEPTRILVGKLKSEPRAGRPDSSGLPTAWARFAAHEEGSRQARLYLATFHRETAAIVLTLSVDAALTAEGYPHPSREPGRLPTFSVVHLLRYPGKPERTGRSGDEH